MTTPRFYCPSDIRPGQICALPKSAAHHALRVLRLAIGDEITLFNGDGAEYPSVILSAEKQGLSVHVESKRLADREPQLAITLAQSLCAADKMDFVLQKAVELGAARFQPVIARRSVARLAGEKAEKRREHWRNVVVAACEQCGRNRMTEVAPTDQLIRWLGDGIQEDGKPAGVRLVLLPGSERRLRDVPLPVDGTLTLLVGPEGGFTPEEEEAARRAGFIPVMLGPRILRTETAAVAAISAVQALWGDI